MAQWVMDFAVVTVVAWVTAMAGVRSMAREYLKDFGCGQKERKEGREEGREGGRKGEREKERKITKNKYGRSSFHGSAVNEPD